MQLNPLLTDDTILSELGERLARRRLARGMTQADLAQEAGVAKRTVERLEAGHSVQLVTLVRLCRVLGLMDQLDQLFPAEGPSPLALLQDKIQVQGRKRAPGRRAAKAKSAQKAPGKPWTWGEDK